MNLEQLREMWRAAFKRCEDLRTKVGTEKRLMTDEERTALDTDLKALDDLDADIKRAEAIEARAASNQTRADQQVTRPGAAATTHDNREDEPFKHLAEQLRSIRMISESRGAQYDPRLRKFDLSSMEVRAAAGMNEGVGSEGGFLVGTDMGAMIEKTAFETGALASRVQRIPISSNANSIKMPYIDETSRANGSRWGGVRTYWLAEAGTITASKPAVGQFEMGLNKLGALVYLTDEVMMDASATSTIVNNAVGEELAFAVDDAIFRGTGAGMPRGILNEPSLVSVAKEGSQVNDTIVYENVSKMRVRMTPRMYAGAFWFVNSECMPQLEQMSIKIKNVAGSENVGGMPVFIPPGGATATPYGQILGRPIVPVEQCEALGDKGDIMLLNLSYYYMTTKGGVQTASSIHVNFLTDEQAFRFIMRVDGRSPLKAAITPFKGSASLSPFVTLDAR